MAESMVDASIFEHLQSKIDEDATVREVFTVLFCGYLGGFSDASNNTSGNLLTIEQVGNIVGGKWLSSSPPIIQLLLIAFIVPVNLKDRDAFHLTIEEYLLALISLIDELARLARNTVTLGDYARPLHISRFIKDLHAGFQILNLKNDLLRRRSDGIKYKVKEVEDVVYDLSLRNLVPKEDSI
ncbi:MAG: hypothetical protein M1820_000428 [Bogoriella megaspora]|nr:MAG: hypothetical protein M1820_000428 [Bogoriella megaspora]